MKISGRMLNLLTATTSTFTLVVMEMEELVRWHSKEAQPTHSTHSPHRQVTSQPSTLKLLTKATEIQMLTMLFSKDYQETPRLLISSAEMEAPRRPDRVCSHRVTSTVTRFSDLAEPIRWNLIIVADGDEDGLNDGAEVAAGTNPNTSDSDY